jgi:predicted hotdog family 3-hydroxylacyl-ACP dehydratase
MIATKNEILEYIPQRPPIVMVDSLISIDEKTTVSGFMVTKENIFVENNKFREPGLVENVAQSAALGVGYVCKQNNTPVPIGFIGGVKNLIINELPLVGDDLRTEITVDYKVFEATLITGKIFVEQRLMAQCEMKIFLKNA